MIKYEILFQLLKERNMKKTDLLNVISPPTLAKLSKNEIINSDTIDKLCIYLKVQPHQIMECYEETLIKTTRTDSKGEHTFTGLYEILTGDEKSEDYRMNHAKLIKVINKDEKTTE